MNAQRKRYVVGSLDSFNLKDAQTVVSLEFNDSNAVNVHGVNISLGVVPAADDEIMRGRWYVVALPRSIAEDATIRGQWIGQLDNFNSAQDAIDGSSMVWGSGVFTTTSGGPFNVTFSPKTSRNMQSQAQLRVLVVADSVTGLLDEWEAIASISCFTT